MASGYDTPVDAALEGYPRRHVRVIASSVYEDSAVVLLDVRPDGPPYLYQERCRRIDGRWHGASSGNGGSWEGDEDGICGSLTLWSEAPAGADRVRVSCGEWAREEPVNGGAWLCVWWSAPEDWVWWPWVSEFRVNGQWSAPRHT